MDRSDRQKDNIRRIRGGLLLYADFHRHDHQQLPPEYEVLKNATEDDLIDDPAFSVIIFLQSEFNNWHFKGDQRTVGKSWRGTGCIG